MKTRDLTLHKTSEGWRLYLPRTTDAAIASGHALCLLAGAGEPAQDDYYAALDNFRNMDIVKRLTAADDMRYPGDPIAILCGQAADEIEQLRGLLAEALDSPAPAYVDPDHPQWAERVRAAISQTDPQ